MAFFLYDVPKILLLPMAMVFLVTTIRTFFSVERTRALLGGKRLGLGNALAAMLGVVTPFCSCSAVPLFIGFLESSIPLGVTFSFLIATPMVNEVALAMLFGLFGWQIAGLYMMMGLAIAILAGIVIGRMPNVERGVEDFVWQVSVGQAEVATTHLSWQKRFQIGWQGMREIVSKVWPYVVIGIAVGAGIHGFVPEDALADILGKGAWWSVPAGVVLGIPLYSNAAGVIPVVHALMEKGAALRDDARLHDERCGAELAGIGHLAPGPQATPHRRIRRRGGAWNYSVRVFLQLHHLSRFLQIEKRFGLEQSFYCFRLTSTEAMSRYIDGKSLLAQAKSVR